MLYPLVLSPADVISGAVPNCHVGDLVNHTSGTILMLVDDGGGRFYLSGTSLFTGRIPTDIANGPFIEIRLREEDYQRNTHLYTVIRIQVHPAHAVLANAPPNFIPSGHIQSGTVNSSAISAGGAAPPDPPKSFAQIMGEAIRKNADLFVGESYKTFRPEGVVIAKTRIALFSKQHAEMIPASVRSVRIAGEGEKYATMVCLPDERYDYQSQWIDCTTVGMVAEGDIDG